MAENETEVADDEQATDSESFVRFIEAKYGEKDDARDRAASGDAEEIVNVQDDEDEPTTEDDDEGTEEPTASGHSADAPDGDAAESDEDSTDDEDDEPPEAKAEDSSEEVEAEDVDEEEDVEVGDEFRELAEQAAVKLTLDDVPAGPARKLVAQRIKELEAMTTRATQDARAYRADEIKFRAEEKFRQENPQHVIAEMLLKDPELFDKVNALMGKADDPDMAEALKTNIESRRNRAADSVRQEDKAREALNARAEHVETYARKLANKTGLPWEFAESAVERALLRKPLNQRDLTDSEVAEAVKLESENYFRHVRAHRREESKKVVQQRTAGRQVTPGRKAPGSASSPKPTNGARPPKIDYNSAESRQAAMMASARRIKPGVRDEDDFE